MKKIIITVAGGFIARNILRSGVLDKFLAYGCEVVLVVTPDKLEYYQKEFSGPKVRIVRMPLYPNTFIDRFFAFLARNTMRTESVSMLQKSDYQGRKRPFIFFVKRLLYFLGAFRFFQALVRFGDNCLVRYPVISEFILKEKPDIVFATNVIENMDVVLLREARRLDIAIAGMAKSWDNLTNHGIIRVLPPRLLVHNPFLKMCAMRYHFIPESRIKVVGIPHYDWYVDPEILKSSREEFLRNVGLDPAKKLILIAGIGDFLAPHEWEIAKIINEAIEKEKIKGSVNVLFRPHPNFMANREKIIGMKNIKFDDGVAHYTSAEKGSWEMSKAEIAHLVNSLRYADVVINIASSMTIDAVAFDRPVICAAFDGESKEPYWDSVARFYTDFTHYKLLTETRGFKLAHSSVELIQYINDYLKNPAEDAVERRKIFSEFIWRLDGHSAERLVSAVLGKYEL
ncbi:MAG: CDP-glycerol glycerophosphotransferase family protein [Candidatus Sungbacteria bacterium]|nr:CDP-glycerol glycerophosphotransferase family protein [Candidatus Sungbacteria bacterium]